MFDIGSSELLLIAVVAVLVIGPKDLPRALYKFGQVVGKARAMARHFRSGIDAMIREAELDELKKQWEAENARIMAQTSIAGDLGGNMLPLPDAERAEPDAGAATPPSPGAAEGADEDASEPTLPFDRGVDQPAGTSAAPGPTAADAAAPAKPKPSAP